MEALLLKSRAPRPQADNTGWHTQAGPLTPHMIQQEKRMESYEKENAVLRQQIAELKTAATP